MNQDKLLKYMVFTMNVYANMEVLMFGVIALKYLIIYLWPH